MSSHCLPSCPETCQNSDTSAGTESLGRCRTDSPRKDGPGPEGRSGLELEAGVEDVLHGSVATCPLASSLQGWGGGACRSRWVPGGAPSRVWAGFHDHSCGSLDGASPLLDLGHALR